MAMTATLSFLLLLVVLYLIGRPYLVPEMAEIGRGDLEDERARLTARLDDLEMEYSTGKLTEDDYRAERDARVADLDRTEQALAGLDDDEPGPDDRDVDDADDDDPLERMIAARRRALAASSCPACDEPYDPDDHFCRSCGTDLSEVRSS